MILQWCGNRGVKYSSTAEPDPKRRLWRTLAPCAIGICLTIQKGRGSSLDYSSILGTESRKSDSRGERTQGSTLWYAHFQQPWSRSSEWNYGLPRPSDAVSSSKVFACTVENSILPPVTWRLSSVIYNHMRFLLVHHRCFGAACVRRHEG